MNVVRKYFLLAILLILAIGGGATSAGAELFQYQGTATIHYSSLGEMPGFEYPDGYEHILIGTWLEGWVISYNVAGEERHHWAAYDNSDYGIVGDSYTVLQDDEEGLKIESVTRTSDNILEVRHLLEMDRSESRVFLNMTVGNIGEGMVGDIRIKRVCDLDLDTGGDFGWADFDDWFDLTENGVLTYTENPEPGREAHSMAMYGIPTPDWFGADNWDDWRQRENTVDFTVYPVYGDYTATLSWDLGDLEVRESAATVTAVYSMGVSQTNKPNGETTDGEGTPQSEYAPSDSLYVVGDLFPVSSEVDVYVVPNQGWAGGETIPADAGDGMDTLVTDSEGAIAVSRIWASPLTPGDYDVVFDANRNGIYDYISDGVIGAGEIGFSVTVPSGLPPTADAGDDQSVYEYSEVTLDGSGSAGSGTPIVSYEWEQLSGEDVVLSDSTAVQPNFSAPPYASEGMELVFRLTVTDDSGASATDECTVTVRDNFPPAVPVPVSPDDGAVFAAGTDVVIQLGPFSDPEDDAHVASVLMIRRADLPAYERVEVTEGNLNEFVLSGLATGLQYAWKAGCRDSGSREYSWSEERTFIVGVATQDAGVKVPPGLGVKDYRMVSITQWPDDPAATSVFGVEADTSIYRIGTYDAMTGAYVELGDPALLVKPGSSYWLLVKGGFNPVIDGIPVSLDVDIEVELTYNEETGNGWNMIAPPNRANYCWDDVQVVEYDENGNMVGEPIAIGDLPVENDFIDTRLWRWGDGAYYSDTELMEMYGGYWSKAKKGHLYLRFPVAAQLNVGNLFMARVLEKAHRFNAGFLAGPKNAFAVGTGDTPPMPMSAFGADAAGGEDGSGCFIGSLSGQ